MSNQVAEKIPNIYSYIIQEESAFRTTRVPLATNWRDWNMFEHIDRSFTLKNSRFYLGSQDYTRPFNNIILPIANVNYRTEGFDVSDVQLYVDNKDNYHKSFMARKFHIKWAKKNQINTAIDESVESYWDYGLLLLKNVNEVRPEVVNLQQLAFCDQTDIMSGPICIKHHFSISELLEFKGNWDNDMIDRAILMARTSKDVDASDGDEAQTPGKYIEVYELHGTFPENWLGAEKLGEDFEDTGKYSPQVHLITYYVSPTDGKSKVGVTLFKGKEPKSVFKALKRDPIHGRACGRGGIEELFHSQIWTNYSELHISQMLEATSKVILKTNKKKITALNNFSNIKQGQILDLGDDGRLEQLILQPINKAHFDNAINKWEQIGRGIGGAADPQLGITPVSGTPLGTTEIVTAQGQGIHDYRQGKIAEFWQEVYRDWVLPHLQKEINKGHEWLDDIALDEMEDLAERIAVKKANSKIKGLVLEGKEVTKEEQDLMMEVTRENFMKGKGKKPLKIFEGEFDGLPMDVEVSISGKQKNLAEAVAKLNSIFRFLFTPGAAQVLKENKGLAELLNEILEMSGLSPVRFSGVAKEATPAQTTQTSDLVTPELAATQ